MPRLIDADKLEEYKASGILELTEWQQGWNEALDTVINEVPTVEAVPTEFHDKCMQIEKRFELELKEKHGHWENYLTEGLRWKCSECGSRFETPYHYCPNCGAKMDEGEEDAKTD